MAVCNQSAGRRIKPKIHYREKVDKSFSNTKMKALHMTAFVILVIGGLNWLLRVFGVDLETWGLPMIVTQIVYILVGLSAIYIAVTHRKDCKTCEMGPMKDIPKM